MTATLTSSAICRSLTPAHASLGEHLLQLEQARGRSASACPTTSSSGVARDLAPHAGRSGGRARRAPGSRSAAAASRVASRRSNALGVAAALDVAQRRHAQVEAEPLLVRLEVLRQPDGVVRAPSATTTSACALPRS